MKIILCSSSPTRANLLKNANIEFTQISCDFDEDSILEKEPIKFVTLATNGKFEACIKCQGDAPPIISADTVISANGKLLRKAYSKEEAKNILLSQSGEDVEIITSMKIGYKGEVHSYLDKTVYKFKKFDENDLENYLNSDEWRGKAGACMVEGFCKKYIENVKGYESTAMGLTVEHIGEFLKKFI
jgi:septum formation protein